MANVGKKENFVIIHLRPVYTTIFLARYLFEFGPGAKHLWPGTLGQ